MPENNFEKRVQSLMDELKFTPSEEVWPAINNRIQKKRRRRFIFFLLPFLSALFIGGFIFYKNDVKPVNTNLTVQAPLKTEIQESEIKSDPASIQPKIENADAGNTIHNETNSISSGQNKNQPIPVQNYNPSLPPGDNMQITVQQSNFTDIQNETTLTGDNLIVKDLDEKSNGTTGISDEELMQRKNDHLFYNPIILDNTPVQVIDNLITPNSDSRLKKNVMDVDLIKPGLITMNDVVDKSSSKWKLGFHVTAGSSKTGSKVLPGLQEGGLSMDLSNAPNAGGLFYGGPIFTRPPQKSKTGVSVEAGIILQKQFTERSSMMVGLQYFYANDQLLAGTQYRNSNQLNFSGSSSLGRYYSGNNAWYTNHYHFIELPVQYGYLLNKKSNLPVRLHAGVIVSQLISTNGLIYDPALTGIYFHDRKQFNNTGLSLSSGLSMSFNQNNKFKWSIGPQVRAGLTSLRKPSSDYNKYLISGGLQFKLFID